MRTLSLTLGLALISGTLAQPAQQTEPSDAKNLGVLEGRVVNAKTGEPVPQVNLTLSGPQDGRDAVATDADGKFRIEKVEPGSYMLTAERRGFTTQAYGAGRNSMMGVSIRVAPAQELKDLNFKLIPYAVVTGRVLDEEGEPLPRAQVNVMARRFMRGRQQLMPVGSSQTTATGEFRVADLAPGRYWVCAMYRPRTAASDAAPAGNTDHKPEKAYVTTCYPESIEPAAALPVDLQPGQEMPGVDIRMRKAEVYRIRGKIVGGPNPVRDLMLTLFPRDRAEAVMLSGSGGAKVKEDGAFEITGVQPGSYYLTSLPTQGSKSSIGKVPVEVSRENFENIVLPLGIGGSLTGNIRLDGDVTQPEPKVSFGAVRVQLSRVDNVPIGSSATPKEDGSFVLENVGWDKYRIVVVNLPPGTWLKSVRAGEQEVRDSGVDFSGGIFGPLQITLGLGLGQISGVVRDEKQQPSVGSIVTLVPDPLKEDRSDFFRLRLTDQAGQFTLQGIPPGEYKLFAWSDIDTTSLMDPEFLKPHESKAQKITIKPNSQQYVSVTQIPAADAAR